MPIDEQPRPGQYSEAKVAELLAQRHFDNTLQLEIVKFCLPRKQHSSSEYTCFVTLC
jgi:hypothetical protein